MPRRSLLAVAVFACVSAGPLRADLVARTFLVDVSVGSAFEGDVNAAARGGYELVDGTQVEFEQWYSSSWRTMHIGFLTELGERTGLLWGLSTGERGEKYRIGPGLTLGLLHRVPVGRQASVTLRADTMLGGDLREGLCIADYGEIGGIRPVNCRLAASPLPPEETLAYRMRRDGWETTRASVTFELLF